MIYVKNDYEYGGALVTVKGAPKELRQEFDSMLREIGDDNELLSIFLDSFNKIAPQIKERLGG